VGPGWCIKITVSLDGAGRPQRSGNKKDTRFSAADGTRDGAATEDAATAPAAEALVEMAQKFLTHCSWCPGLRLDASCNQRLKIDYSVG
jgi:hypothetical protein